MNSPISSSDFNPLLPPGGGVPLAGDQPGFRAGDHVRAMMDNTAFFKRLPKGDADADKTLVRDTKMKIIRVAGSYLQVELDNTGEVGYVPAIMVEEPTTKAAALPGSPNEYQVYPPLPGSGGGTALPPVDPAGQPPEGAIPTVIDPEAPAAPTAAAEADPVAPIEPKTAIPDTKNSKPSKDQ